MRFLLLILLFVIFGPAHAADSPLAITGNEARALMVATHAFQSQIDEIPKDREFTAFLSELKNYSVGIDDEECCFEVKFTPTKYHGRTIFWWRVYI